MEKMNVISFSEVEAEEISWLFYPYIAYGKVTLLGGEAGCGKTMAALALAAILSKGGKLPLQSENTEPINILYQTAEDGLADTIIPRLLMFGANMNRISAIQTDDYLTFSNRGKIEEAIIRNNIRLMIFDPFQAFVGKANMSSANEMRMALREIVQVAQKHKCAVVIVCHTGKSTNYASLLQRIIGSTDIGAIARSALYLTNHPSKKDVKVLCHVKSNLAPIGQSIDFQITENGIQWLGYSEIGEKDLLGHSSDGAFQNSVDFLKMLLANQDMPSTQVYDMAAKAGIGFSTLKKAKRYLGIKAAKAGNIWYFKQYIPKEGFA